MMGFAVRMLGSILKPHYLYRPRQAGRRLLQALSRSLPASALVTLPWGLPLRVDATEDVGGSIWRLGLYDLAVSETLWRLLAPGDLAVDVGANIGYMSSIMALRAGPSGRVLAFEPHPMVFRHLAGNVLGFGRHPATAPVEASPAALGETIGRAYLDCGDSFAQNQGTSRVTDRESPVSVAMTTLDHALGGRTAAVVKIDVEGGEARVLQGAVEALREGRIRNVVYEAYAAEQQGLADLLLGYGYQVFALGWTFRGLLLAAPGDFLPLPGYEAPSYLATRDPDAVLARLRPRGWQVL
jgi:FkbM family methyltransferase